MITRCTWPRDHAGEAVAALARSAGLRVADVRIPRTSDAEHAAAWLGLEAEPADSAYEDVDPFARKMAPALVDVPNGWLVVAKTDRRAAELIAPDGSRAVISSGALRDVLTHDVAAKRAPIVERILSEAGVPERRRPRAREALLRRQLGIARVGRALLLRLPPGASFSAQLGAARVPSRIATILAAHGVRYALVALGWWLVGRAAIEGRGDWGVLVGWALVLITQIPFTIYVAWAQGAVSVDGGALLKRRLLAGALALPTETIRTEGAGHLLGRVLEADAVEALALGAGFATATALVEISVATVVLALGANAAVMATLLVAWTVVTAVACARYAKKRRGWTDARLRMTHDLVERMVGHRTRLAQQAPSRWHDGEDDLLSAYANDSTGLDRLSAGIWAFIPRGWLVVALVCLLPTLTRSSAEIGSTAVSIGGALLAYRALRKLVVGLAGASGAAIAWEKVRPLMEAAACEEPPATAEPPPPPSPGALRLEATGVTYRYRPDAEPVLRDCSLTIAEGDRVLLCGRSGAGKSTLAGVLSGLREPQAGLVLLGGLDRQTLGRAGFRRLVAVAPQFHENFVMGSSLAFNLLMGRSWPPRDEDLDAAEQVCRDLGLGPLLDRMPGGLQQHVGETGWQLSHGERSRVFLARALLQGGRIIILDESFGALDPPTLESSIARVLCEDAGVVVIAHP